MEQQNKNITLNILGKIALLNDKSLEVVAKATEACLIVQTLDSAKLSKIKEVTK